MAAAIEVSIVVPVYNPPIERFQSCLKSVIAQSSDAWELVLVDDGSTDTAVLNELACVERRYDRVKVIRQENAGPSTARNVGTRSASGKYVTYVDCDDELPPKAIEMAVSKLDEHRPDLLQFYVQYVTSEQQKIGIEEVPVVALSNDQVRRLRGRVMSGRMPETRIRNRRAVMKNGPIARYVRTDIAKRVPFPPEIRVSEDTVWNLLLLNEVDYLLVSRSIGYWYWTDLESSVRGYRPNAYEETKQLLKLLNEMQRSHLTAVPVDDYYERALGEVNRCIRLNFSRPESPISEREKRGKIRDLLDTIEVSRRQALRSRSVVWVKLVAKHTLLASGMVGPCYAVFRAARAGAARVGQGKRWLNVKGG